MNPILTKTLLAGLSCCAAVYSTKAQNAFVNNGASIYLQSGAAIYVQGNLENTGSGSFTNNGSIYATGNLFSNSSANLNAINAGSFYLNGTTLQTISGTTVPNFYNLVISKSSAQAQLQTNITLSNQLTLTNGNLFLNNYQVDLLTTGSLIGENASRRVYDNVTNTGRIKVSAVLNAPSAANPGNLGAIITAPQNLGLTTITRSNQAQFVVSNYSIARYYDIVPTNNSNLTATLRFMYEDAELNGVIESELGQWHTIDNIAWQRRYGVLNTTSNYVELTNINFFKRISLASNNITVLPLHLLDFTVTKSGEKGLLHWKTVDEMNTDRFEVERSADGATWTTIGTVTAHNNAGFQYYDLIDPTPLSRNYYRLKMIDKDQKYIYSPVRLLQFDKDNLVRLYPTLASSRGTLYLDGVVAGKALVEIYDSRGRIVQREKLIGNTITLTSLTTGAYYVRVTENDRNMVLLNQKIVIQ